MVGFALCLLISDSDRMLELRVRLGEYTPEDKRRR